MRKTKFRGMCVMGNWYYGNLCVLKVGNKAVEAGSYISNDGGFPFAYQVRPETVGEFTGLIGKNSVEVYENSICKYKDDSNTEQIGIVKYTLCEFYLEAIGGDDEGNQDIELHPDYDIEVIGNIFENGELLNAK